MAERISSQVVAAILTLTEAGLGRQCQHDSQVCPGGDGNAIVAPATKRYRPVGGCCDARVCSP
jgi:hypothetical protein